MKLQDQRFKFSSYLPTRLKLLKEISSFHLSLTIVLNLAKTAYWQNLFQILALISLQINQKTYSKERHPSQAYQIYPKVTAVSSPFHSL